MSLIWYLTTFLTFHFCNAGVAGLTKYFRDGHSKAWTVATPTNKKLFLSTIKQTDHLCVDMNQILHNSCRSIDDPKHMVSRIFSHLDSLLRVCIPRKTLLLAFDGPAPFAKLQTQRSRRKSTPSNCLLTPGTDFMNFQEDIMLCYVLQRICTRFQNITVFISGPDIPGEGELKIVDWIYATHPPRNETIVLAGTDSDIILQALSLEHSFNCGVLQCGSEYTDAVCNATALYHSLVTKMFSGQSSNTDFETSEYRADPRSRFDVLLLFLLQGNDYLPKLRGHTIPRVLKIYAEVLQALPPDSRYLYDIVKDTFNFDALLLLCRGLGSSGGVALPIIAPGATQTLHNLMQRNKSLIVWNETPVAGSDVTGKPSLRWGGRVEFQNKTYASEPVFSSKREMKRNIAMEALRDIDPEGFKAMMLRQLEAKAELDEIKESVKRENGAFASSIIEPIATAAAAASLGNEGDAMILELDDDDSVVSEEEYAKYVHESDIVEYLRGLLWVVRMYRTGKCPDVAYSYHNRPSLTPHLLARYIEWSLKERGHAFLSAKLSSATSVPSPLSADATVCCVIPGNSAEYVPSRLRGPWLGMQRSFFQKLTRDSLSNTTYETMVTTLQRVWNASYSPTNSTGTYEVNQRHNQRRQNRRKRKEEGVSKQLQKLSFATMQNSSGIYRDTHSDSSAPSIFNDKKEWLVISNVSHLIARKYPFKFRRVPVVLPLTLPFVSPSRVPVGVQILRGTSTSTSSGQERFELPDDCLVTAPDCPVTGADSPASVDVRSSWPRARRKPPTAGGVVRQSKSKTKSMGRPRLTEVAIRPVVVVTATNDPPIRADV